MFEMRVEDDNPGGHHTETHQEGRPGPVGEHQGDHDGVLGARRRHEEEHQLVGIGGRHRALHGGVQGAREQQARVGVAHGVSSESQRSLVPEIGKQIFGDEYETKQVPKQANGHED